MRSSTGPDHRRSKMDALSSAKVLLVIGQPVWRVTGLAACNRGGVAGLVDWHGQSGRLCGPFDVRPEVAEQIESMGAEFLMLEFDEDGSGDGRYAKPASPEFIERKWRCSGNRPPDGYCYHHRADTRQIRRPSSWPAEMVGLMKPGSVVVDRLLNRAAIVTKPGEIVKTENDVTIVGYTDFPSPHGRAKSSSLYATNLRHMTDDLTPEKDGAITINMEDDVIRGATIVRAGGSPSVPPPPKGAGDRQSPGPEGPGVERRGKRRPRCGPVRLRKSRPAPAGAVKFWGLFMLLIGQYADQLHAAFYRFALSCFVGFRVIWNVSHALHTPLMAITNAISGIIILGTLLQIGSRRAGCVDTGRPVSADSHD